MAIHDALSFGLGQRHNSPLGLEVKGFATPGLEDKNKGSKEYIS